MDIDIYNPEKPFNKKILDIIKQTWNSSVIIESGYPIIKDKFGYYIEHVDGIGTKGYLHWIASSYAMASIDAFAMNVNDLAILGFRPKTLNCHLILQEERQDVIIDVIKKITDLCLEYGIIFIGGETAILDTIKGMEIGLHVTGETNLIINKSLEAGDLIYGHLSDGIHSNGLTLARKLLNINLNEYLASELTIPTKIYLNTLEKTKFSKKRMHITGGAFTKLKKLIGNKQDLLIDLSHVKQPKIFGLIFEKLNERISNPSYEMLRNFNCGIGFIEIIDPIDKQRFEKSAPDSILLGEVLSEGNGNIILISPFDKLSVQY